MRVKVFTPRPPLLPYIEAYYFTSPDTPSYHPTAHFPAGSHSYLKFSAPSGILSGQTTFPAEVAAAWDVEGFGVKLRLGAVHALFGIPAHEITNRIVNLEDVMGNTAGELIERLATSSTPEDKTRHVERIFTRLAQKSGEKNFSTERAAVAALSGGRFDTVARLAEQLGYSPRQLQRKLNDFIGLTPRQIKRISRFERACRLIQASARKEGPSWSSWSDIAFSCGYSDQSHFIRDFREFAGCTPATFVSNADLSDSFNTREVSSPIIVLS